MKAILISPKALCETNGIATNRSAGIKRLVLVYGARETKTAALLLLQLAPGPLQLGSRRTRIGWNPGPTRLYSNDQTIKSVSGPIIARFRIAHADSLRLIIAAANSAEWMVCRILAVGLSLRSFLSLSQLEHDTSLIYVNLPKNFNLNLWIRSIEIAWL